MAELPVPPDVSLPADKQVEVLKTAVEALAAVVPSPRRPNDKKPSPGASPSDKKPSALPAPTTEGHA